MLYSIWCIQVITEDGYVLRLERFPQGQFNHRGRRNKPPVFIQHGILVVMNIYLIRKNSIFIHFYI